MPKGMQLNAIDTDQLNIFIVNLNILVEDMAPCRGDEA